MEAQFATEARCASHFSDESVVFTHRRRSGWTYGGTHGERRRWVGAEWDGVSPLQPTRGSGERRELPQRGPGRAPAEKGGGQFALASPILQIWGTRPSCPPPPWSTPMFSLTASKEFELLCKTYSVTQPQAHGRFRPCVWQAFVCHLAGF